MLNAALNLEKVIFSYTANTVKKQIVFRGEVMSAFQHKMFIIFRKKELGISRSDLTGLTYGAII